MNQRINQLQPILSRIRCAPRRLASRLPCWFVILITLIVVTTNHTHADELALRGQSNPINGNTLEVNEKGVLYRSGNTASTLHSWDQVRTLTSSSPSHRADFQKFQSLAEDLWRARSRAERQDYALAEPLFEKYFDAMQGRNDPTALVVAEGLLRCRLARNARAGAVLPWLETARMQSRGITHRAYTKLPPVLDPNSKLCPQLAPLWVPSPALESMLAALETYIPIEAPVIESLRQLYLQSAYRALKRTPSIALESPDTSNSSASNNGVDPAQSTAVIFISAFLDATAPINNEIARRQAVKRLSRWIPESDWRGAWAHYARGMARLQSDTEDEQDRGLVDLLYLPSEYIEVDWYLAGFALQDAVEYLTNQNRTQAALLLQQDYRNRFTDHPILQPQRIANASPTAPNSPTDQ